MPCFHIFVLFVGVILLLKMVPKLSAEMLSSVPEHKKAAACCMEKTLVFNNFCSGMSYSDVGCEFSDKKSTM